MSSLSDEGDHYFFSTFLGTWVKPGWAWRLKILYIVFATAIGAIALFAMGNWPLSLMILVLGGGVVMLNWLLWEKGTM